MLVLRCTKKLLGRMDVTPVPEREVPVARTRLGEWLANITTVDRRPLVLAVSSRTLLPVLLPLAPAKTLASRFPGALAEMLEALIINGARIDVEVAALSEHTIAATNNRRVLGTMNDFIFMMPHYAPGTPLIEEALQLAKAPCSPIGMESPDQLTRQLFATEEPPRLQ